MFSFSQLPDFLEGQMLQLIKDETIEYLVIDSRKLFVSPRSLFFAIEGVRNDGHAHIATAYEQGVRLFIIERDIETERFPEGSFLKVSSSLKALQSLATVHRSQFGYSVLGITGSNGKTIIKEWLFQMLSSKLKCVKNPGSYNSQVGVPLSVWQMSHQHEFGIFEAGISLPGEMEALQKIIQPSIGLFTMLGSAHDEGFSSSNEKLLEKLKLFESCQTIIYCYDDPAIRKGIASIKKPFQESISWGESEGSDILLEFNNVKSISITGKFGQQSFVLPFVDTASQQNVMHCIMVLLHLGYTEQEIQERIDQLRAVPMRLELKQGINQCQIIDDTYNNDLGGLRISLDFLEGINMPKRTLILSDILQSGLTLDKLAQYVFDLIREKQIQKFIGIGFGFHSQQQLFKDLRIESSFYLTTEDFLKETDWNSFVHEAILVKGARVFQFERITKLLQKKAHGTTMEVDLSAMVYNLNYFRSLLQPDVKLMVMVKAFAYGSGSNEIASLLQYHRVDYLGVAYTDEGVDLRNNNIDLPIMVMNPSKDSWGIMLDRNLEPEIYSLSLLRSLVEYLNGKPCLIHLKIDTGMHRLGFELQELSEVVQILSSNHNVKVASVFSHLAGADDPVHDDFSSEQAKRYNEALNLIQDKLKINPIRHLLNSSGILRLPEYQLDMVRLGIGLYGIDPTGAFNNKLQSVATLKTVVSQVKKIKPGESIGYSRKGKATKSMTTATIAIGYADGYSRSFGNGAGQVSIRGKKATVVGNVCMDMTMVDVTDIPEVAEGDEVIIFGKDNSIHEVAAQAQTIPYEILTNTSERVKRIFIAEGI
ncbi:MAG TPA: bifunctional UDP-N-acetylmuramoyl-tripeptide:D-alanyl-D-alanine ligase/alanine racemase [Cyclobacteriaceae bacterium]|nr:bifunctional UDP-N-acetylmuramoyl-tripeptide:D-alanyl-D-alanine ligase/alanine racemase [Cyclobacteriaceae bacterium]